MDAIAKKADGAGVGILLSAGMEGKEEVGSVAGAGGGTDGTPAHALTFSTSGFLVFGH